MADECDDCGADGEALLCICKPKEPKPNAKRTKADTPAGDGVVPRAAVGRGRRGGNQSEPLEPQPGPDDSAAAAHSNSAPQSQPRPGGLRITTPLTTAFSGAVIAGAQRLRVKCCRCGDIHFHDERTNEWGKAIGTKWMAGRQSWCPAGCGYHVTIPADHD